MKGRKVFLFASMIMFFAAGLALAQQPAKSVAFNHEHHTVITGPEAALAQQPGKPVILTANVDFQQELSSNPNTSQSGGIGSAVFVLSADRTKVDYAVAFVGLTSAARVAHLHGPAPFGSNGGVKRDLCGTGATPPCAEGTLYTGTWSTTDMQPLTEDLVNSLLTGQIYVNVHTPMNGGGEIRGQVIPISPK